MSTETFDWSTNPPKRDVNKPGVYSSYSSWPFWSTPEQRPGSGFGRPWRAPTARDAGMQIVRSWMCCDLESWSIVRSASITVVNEHHVKVTRFMHGERVNSISLIAWHPDLFRAPHNRRDLHEYDDEGRSTLFTDPRDYAREIVDGMNDDDRAGIVEQGNADHWRDGISMWPDMDQSTLDKVIAEVEHIIIGG